MRQQLSPAFALLILGSVSSHAGVVTIPWVLDFGFTPGSRTEVVKVSPGGGQITLPNFETGHEISRHVKGKIEVPIIGTDIASIDVRTGLRFPTQARSTFQLHLPLQVTLSAPDYALPGQNVFVGTSIGLTQGAYFSANGKIAFETEAFLKGHASLGPFHGSINIDAPLPDGLSYGGSGLRLGGSDNYVARDNSASTVSVGPFARQTMLSGQRLSSPQQRFEGLQFQTDGRIDAQRGELNLLDLLKSVPLIGSAVAAVDTVLDLDLRAGVDLTERTTLSTGAMYALYSEYGGQGAHKTALLNSLGTSGFSLTVPQQASGSYAIDLYGMGLGFGLQREMLMTPEMSLVLDAIDPFGEWKLLSADLGDAWQLGRQYSRFQYEEHFWPTDYAHHIPQEQRLLSFLLNAPAPPGPSVVLPDLPLAPEDVAPFDDPFTTVDRPGTAPIDGTVEYVAVTEPATFVLLAAMLPGLLLTRRRRWIG